MDRDAVRQALHDYRELRGSRADRTVDPEVDAVTVAIFLEDLLDITLTDDEIRGGDLLDPHWWQTLAERREAP
jgi:hypothetical protein